jgi:hypothetical protein
MINKEGCIFLIGFIAPVSLASNPWLIGGSWQGITLEIQNDHAPEIGE